MHPFRFRITLRLRHPVMDPDAISANLRMQPRIRQMVGKARMTLTGEALEGVYDRTYWSGQGVAGEGFDLAEKVEAFVVRLERRAPFLHEFSATGGSIELFVGWFTDEKNTGEKFPAPLLRRLGELHVDLSFDVYGGPA